LVAWKYLDGEYVLYFVLWKVKNSFSGLPDLCISYCVLLADLVVSPNFLEETEIFLYCFDKNISINSFNWKRYILEFNFVISHNMISKSYSISIYMCMVLEVFMFYVALLCSFICGLLSFNHVLLYHLTIRYDATNISQGESGQGSLDRWTTYVMEKQIQ